MIKPTKEAFLKHDLYTIDDIAGAFRLEDIPEQKIRKLASKGDRFVWCDTDRKDAAHGWFADTGQGIYRAGNCGFGKMTNGWAEKHLTEPTPLVGYKFRQEWDSHTPLEQDDDA